MTPWSVASLACRKATLLNGIHSSPIMLAEKRELGKEKIRALLEKVLPLQTFPLFYPEEVQTFNVQFCVNVIIFGKVKKKKIHGLLCQSSALGLPTILGYI